MKIFIFIILMVFICHVNTRELVFSWKTLTYADAPTTGTVDILMIFVEKYVLLNDH